MTWRVNAIAVRLREGYTLPPAPCAPPATMNAHSAGSTGVITAGCPAAESAGARVPNQATAGVPGDGLDIDDPARNSGFDFGS
jgi:hypothetical protein